MAAGAALLAYSSGGTSYAADVLPSLLLLGAGVGPMFVAISVTAMSDVPAEDACPPRSTVASQERAGTRVCPVGRCR